MNYKVYKYSIKEIFIESGKFIVIIAAFSYFFYRSFIPFTAGIFFTPLFLKIRNKSYKEARNKRLTDEFRESLRSISTGMKAGYSMENAFLEAIKDMKLFYGEGSLMAAELLTIRKGLELNRTIEELIGDLAKRTEIEDIALFSKVLAAAKRNGGSVTEVFENTAERIGEKQELKKEIDLLISEKKLELRIMELVPFFILFYVEVTNKGYFDSLYEGVNGRLFMTGCIIVYFISVYIAGRILRIAG